MTEPRPFDADGFDPAGRQEGDRLKHRIAAEAARSVASGSDATRARLRAGRRLTGGWVEESDLPDTAAVRAAAHSALDPTGALRHLTGDRFDVIAAFVSVLVTVRQDPARHPEGDALEHSLQVFDHVHRERPWDEELLTAALVHDVGLALDRADPVGSGLTAIGDLVTPRTRWLVEQLPAARAHRDRTLGHRARRRLEAHPDFLDALLLADADRRGRIRGYAAPTLDEAIGILRELEADAGDDRDQGGR